MSLIGVFDSGIGGLTVLKSLAENYPQHDFLYLADTARLPYGTKSPKTIASYLERNVAFLSQHNVDFVIVACNSASTVLMDQSPKFKIPVFDVIGPGSEEALRASKTLKIGVLGTRATIQSGAYAKKIKSINHNAEVVSASAPLLVPLVEEGWIDDPLTSMVVYRYVQPLLQEGIDTLILGCTHYPVLKAAFKKVCGSGIELVDSPRALNQTLKREFPNLSDNKDHQGFIQIFCTDLTDHLEKTIQNLIHPLKIKSLETADI